MSKLVVKMLHDRVLVKPDEAEDTTTGGIIIPDTVKKNPPKGTVIAVGPGFEKALDVKEGDKVLYHKFAGEDIILKKEDLSVASPNTSPSDTVTYKSMREAEIIMILP